MFRRVSTFMLAPLAHANGEKSARRCVDEISHQLASVRHPSPHHGSRERSLFASVGVRCASFNEHIFLY